MSGFDLLAMADLSGRDRYQLLTTLVVPRPIGWISTYSADGVRNLAPFSYFSALSPTPMLVGVSVGHRKTGPKDTIVNVRATGAFCANVVTLPFLERMNASSEDVPPEVDEFELAGLTPAHAAHVNAPYVAECPAVLECRLFKEVELEGAANTLLIGEVVAVRLSSELEREPGTWFVKPEELQPVGRLGAIDYALPGEVFRMPRPGSTSG